VRPRNDIVRWRRQRPAEKETWVLCLIQGYWPASALQLTAIVVSRYSTPLGSQTRSHRGKAGRIIHFPRSVGRTITRASNPQVVLGRV
jgi:hypothetical protein